MANKKKKWWHTPSWKGNELNPSLFGNSIQKHSQNLKDKGLLDENGFESEHEDDYGYSSYSWDLDKKLATNNSSSDKKTRWEQNKNDWGNAYNSYEKTGVWGGYYRQPQLTYKYVQQMANALSAQHNIKVQVGNEWKVDLIKRTLTYNPASLIYGTKSELLATLMHEIGKLRYVTHSSMLKNKYLTMYKQPALEVLSVYEDLRTDYLMLKAYESASEIYESVIPTIEKQVKEYMKFGNAFRELINKIPEVMLQSIISDHVTNMPNHTVTPNNPELKQQLFRVFGTTDLDKVKIGLQVVKSNSANKGTIYEYCGEMLSVMYDLDDQHHAKFENIDKAVSKTIGSIEPSKKVKDSQALVDFLDTETYPHIEDLLKETSDQNEIIKNAFPDMPQEILKQIVDQIKNVLGNSNGGVGMDSNGNMKSRTSGASASTIPPEWAQGDYKTLKDSVSMEIKQLVSKLTFLRREELTVRYQADQKRGKLNSKKLYKSANGSRRLFKKKMESIDTIRSFAFSILLDVSGSMAGTRLIQCTRALIMLAEVFKKLQIPFEITTFSNGATNIKAFTSDMTKDMERSIGGLVKYSGGGTNLDQGLNELKIHQQPERNKVVIVITDGGVGYVEKFDQYFFIPWEKKGIKSVGVGIECESQMKDLCQGNSKVLENASQLPIEFSNLLKTLIKRK